MKNLSKIPLEIVQKTILRLNYLTYLALLGRYGYREWCDTNRFNWLFQSSVDSFITHLNKIGRIQEFYKDIMNEISSEINSEDITKDITEED